MCEGDDIRIPRCFGAVNRLQDTRLRGSTLMKAVVRSAMGETGLTHRLRFRGTCTPAK